MSSFRRILSSRANGALSKGPVTGEGKERSSQNALRHGLLSECTVLQSESKDAFTELFEQYIQSFDPSDPVELDQIEEMASAYWRMRRLWAIERKMMDDQIELQPSDDPLSRITESFATLCDTNKINILNRYEARLHRVYQRSLRNLILLRSAAATVKLPNEPS